MRDVDVALFSCDFDKCSISRSPYGYQPSAIANGIFTAIFTAATVSCLIYALTTRRWLGFSTAVSLSCIFEVVGFGARLWSSFEPWDVRLFAVSTSFLTVAPAFSIAGIFTTIYETVIILGAEHSPIEPAKYLQLIWTQGTGFVLQLIGIAVAFLGLSRATGLSMNYEKGCWIMAAGIGFQALSLAYFIIVFAVVIAKAAIMHRHFGYTTFHYEHGFVPLTRNFKFFLVIVATAVICLFARAVFQMTLLSMRIGGEIATNEALFIGFNGFLVALSSVGLATTHPAGFLQDGLKGRRHYQRASNPTLLLRRQHHNWNIRRNGGGMSSEPANNST